MNNLEKGQLKCPPPYICVYNQERMWFFPANIHNFTMFSKLLLFAFSTEILIQTGLLFCHTVIYVLFGGLLGEYGLENGKF